MSYNEFSKPSVGSNGCAYATLNSYNHNYFGRGIATANAAPRASQARSNEVVVIPSYGGPGYQQFSQKNPSCSGYNDLDQAYPNYPSSCGLFSSSLCG